MTTYVLAGGCFWCLDAVFRRLKGVEQSICGYAGGSERDADYYRVSSGKTSHAESIKITFDEATISGTDLLDIFFLIHNPTTKDRQGNDVGPQYRSTMFYENDEQKSLFEAAIRRAKEHWNEPIVSELTQLEKFYDAEPEHQDYFNNNPANPYCSVVIAPKIIKARRNYNHLFNE